MANVIIITTTNSIKVDFGVYASDMPISKGTWNKSSIQHIQLNNNHVYVKVRDGNEWTLNYDIQAKGIIVDSVDGVAPTDLSDLYNKLVAMLS